MGSEFQDRVFLLPMINLEPLQK